MNLVLRCWWAILFNLALLNTDFFHLIDTLAFYSLGKRVFFFSNKIKKNVVYWTVLMVFEYSFVCWAWKLTWQMVALFGWKGNAKPVVWPKKLLEGWALGAGGGSALLSREQKSDVFFSSQNIAVYSALPWLWMCAKSSTELLQVLYWLNSWWLRVWERASRLWCSFSTTLPSWLHLGSIPLLSAQYTLYQHAIKYIQWLIGAPCQHVFRTRFKTTAVCLDYPPGMGFLVERRKNREHVQF